MWEKEAKAIGKTVMIVRIIFIIISITFCSFLTLFAFFIHPGIPIFSFILILFLIWYLKSELEIYNYYKKNEDHTDKNTDI
jgi:hypothetical protein